MPRGIYPRSAAAVSAAAQVLDDELPPGPVQRTVPAAGAKPPATNAARSAFDLVPRRAGPPADIFIRKGVPLPTPVRNPESTGAYLRAAAAMEVGDSVVLPHRHAKSLMRISRDFANGCTPPRHFVIRKLDSDHSGVWRDL